jgi:antitoxin component of MazEF toxin-antitoxin module
MKVVKIRRVGNSNVVSLPHELESRGFTVGTSVMIEELATGELRIIPASRVRELIREAGRRVIAEDQEALRILAAQDGVVPEPIVATGTQAEQG